MPIFPVFPDVCEPIPLGDDRRLRVRYDDSYDPSYWYQGDPELDANVDREIAAINNGDLVAYGFIVETRCPTCGNWDETDAIWGCVYPISDDDEDLIRRAVEVGIIDAVPSA